MLVTHGKSCELQWKDLTRDVPLGLDKFRIRGFHKCEPLLDDTLDVSAALTDVAQDWTKCHVRIK